MRRAGRRDDLAVRRLSLQATELPHSVDVNVFNGLPRRHPAVVRDVQHEEHVPADLPTAASLATILSHSRPKKPIPPIRSREADANAAECQRVRERKIFDAQDKRSPYVPIPMYMYAQRWKQNMTRDFGRVVTWLSLFWAPPEAPSRGG